MSADQPVSEACPELDRRIAERIAVKWYEGRPSDPLPYWDGEELLNVKSYSTSLDDALTLMPHGSSHNALVDDAQEVTP